MRFLIAIILLAFYSAMPVHKETKPQKFAYPSIFQQAYNSGFTTKSDTFTLKFESKTIGKIKISTGKIIACDPAFFFDREPFDFKFPTGEFDVQLSLVQIMNSTRIAYAQIKFSDDEVQKWEHALLKGQSKIRLNDSVTYGFAVDSGTGMFLDSSGQKYLLEMGDKFYKVLEDSMVGKNGVPQDYLIYNFGKSNCALFTSGMGDGSYATYLGLDAHQKPCRLLIDFNFVPWWK